MLADVLKALGKTAELIGRVWRSSAPRIRATCPGLLPGRAVPRRRQQLDKAEGLYTATDRRSRPRSSAIAAWSTSIARRTARTLLLAMLGAGRREVRGARAAGRRRPRRVPKDSNLVRPPDRAGAPSSTRPTPSRPEYGPASAPWPCWRSRRSVTTRAAEFFELAIQAQPGQPAELLLQWGVGAAGRTRSRGGGRRSSSGASSEKTRPEVRAAFYYYWIARPRRPPSVTTKPWPWRARPPSGRRTRPASPAGSAGCCS